ncbi:hypothetical protein ENBRE01_1645 [Enteropsectra breve]|nr:hypothetical protein ENBRE01_1645 [Enteropsectra breve]
MKKPFTAIKRTAGLWMWHGIMLTGFGAALALSISPFNRSEECGLKITVKGGEMELGTYNCLDILSSKLLMAYRIKTKIQASECGDADMMEMSYEADMNHELSIVESLYNRALDVKKSSEDDILTFKIKVWQNLEGNRDYLHAQNLLIYNGKLTLVIPDRINSIHLEYIFKMRNELILEKQESVFIKTLTEMLKLHASLCFKDKLHSDVFFTSANGKSKHLVTSKDYLFAINVAIQLYHRNFFKRYKEYFHYPVEIELKDMQRHPEFHKFKESLVLNKPVWYILSVIDIVVNSNNEITDIVIKHNNEAFGCGLRPDKSLTLGPCFAFGEYPNQAASVFWVFDRLSAYSTITHMRAVCHEKMGKNLHFFYYYLLYLFPRIVSIKLEESDYDEYPNIKEYCDTKTTLNTVLDFMLKPESIARKQINIFSIVGYNVLSDDNLAVLREMPLESLGLFGNFRVKDYINAFTLLSAPCGLRRHLTAFKGSPFCHKLLDAIWPDNKLEAAIFYMGYQDLSVPYEAFAGRDDLYNKIKVYFISQKIEYGVATPQRSKNIERMAIMYRYHYYAIDHSNSEKIMMCAQPPVNPGELENYIFSYYKAKLLILETELYISAETARPAVKQIIFNTSRNKNFKKSYVEAAMKIIDQEHGELGILFSVNTTDENTELMDVGTSIKALLVEIIYQASCNHALKKFDCKLRILTHRALSIETPTVIRSIFKDSIDAIKENKVRFAIDYEVLPTASEYTIENVLLE